MYRYIALIWQPDDSRSSSVAARILATLKQSDGRWTCRVETTGMAVLDISPDSDDLCTYVLAGQCGVILGRLFREELSNSLMARNVELSARDAEQFVTTGGQRLVSGFWGSYIAFLCNPNTGNRFVIRDCSGKIPCFRTRRSNVDIIFSDLQDIAELGLQHFTLNLRYIAAFVHFNELQIRETGLSEVTELLAGECFEPSLSGGRQYLLWDPRNVCRQDPIEDYNEAINAVRETTRRCIDAWASVHKNIIHSLSGGFDSTVVLACLIRSAGRERITCINRYNEQGGEDERKYARLSARHAGIALIERDWSADNVGFDRQLFTMPAIPKPAVPSIFLMLDLTYRNALAERVDAKTFWTGQGGDHLFYQMKTSFLAADYLRRHGLGPRLMSVLSDAARHSKESYWHVIKTALASTHQRRPWRPETLLNRSTQFVNPDALPSRLLEYVTNPSTADSQNLPIGKQLQIYFLAELLNRHRHLPRIEYAEEHHPLIAQPLIEVCLRIPSYILLQGGRNRALARVAFAQDVPKEIAQREGKGQTSSYTAGEMRKSVAFIRETLLDGILARERILDRKSLEAHFSSTGPLRAEQLFPLLAAIAAEVWARGCTELHLKMAA
jgi:asparagine synthase (glutamine-hydrolysing)